MNTSTDIRYRKFVSVCAPIRNTADYSPFGIQLDGRTLSYVPPAPAPPSVTVVYQHKFDDNPSTHPYTTAPNQLNTKLTNVSWTNSQSSWTNFAGFTGKAIATNSATPDTTRLYLNLTVNSGFMLDVKSYSFYHRSSTTGYTNYQLLVNGVLVGSGSIFVSSGSTLQSTGTINVANAIAGLTGSVTVTLKLFGGSNGNNATFRLDDFTLNGYTQEVQVYAEGYRYGFQNQEKDDEVKGTGNSLNYEYRMHDPRVGRFFVVDPLESKYPWNSPYAFSENVVVNSRELEGLERYYCFNSAYLSAKALTAINTLSYDKLILYMNEQIRSTFKDEKCLNYSKKKLGSEFNSSAGFDPSGFASSEFDNKPVVANSTWLECKADYFYVRLVFETENGDWETRLAKVTNYQGRINKLSKKIDQAKDKIERLKKSNIQLQQSNDIVNETEFSPDAPQFTVERRQSRIYIEDGGQPGEDAFKIGQFFNMVVRAYQIKENNDEIKKAENSVNKMQKSKESYESKPKIEYVD